MQLKQETDNSIAFKKEQEMISSVWSGASQEPSGEALSSSWTTANSHRCIWHIEYSTFSLERLGKSVNKGKWCWEGQNNVIWGKKFHLRMHNEITKTFFFRHSRNTSLWKQLQSKEQTKDYIQKTRQKTTLVQLVNCVSCILHAARRSNLPE